MNPMWAGALIAFVVATLLTGCELWTSKYPNTGFLVWRKCPFLAYCIIYGVIALITFLISDALIAKSKLKIEGLGLQYPYVRALILGFSSKAVMQLNLYTVTVGTVSFPLGFKSFVQIFEPHLLRKIDLDEFEAVREFVSPYAARFQGAATDLKTVKDMIKKDIPTPFSQQERAAFQNEIDKEKHVREAMERFLRFTGKRTFVRVFKIQ